MWLTDPLNEQWAFINTSRLNYSLKRPKKQLLNLLNAQNGWDQSSSQIRRQTGMPTARINFSISKWAIETYNCDCMSLEKQRQLPSEKAQFKKSVFLKFQVQILFFSSSGGSIFGSSLVWLIQGEPFYSPDTWIGPVEPCGPFYGSLTNYRSPSVPSYPKHNHYSLTSNNCIHQFHENQNSQNVWKLSLCAYYLLEEMK